MTKTSKAFETHQSVRVNRGTMKGQTGTVYSINGDQIIITFDEGQGYGRTSGQYTAAALTRI